MLNFDSMWNKLNTCPGLFPFVVPSGATAPFPLMMPCIGGASVPHTVPPGPFPYAHDALYSWCGTVATAYNTVRTVHSQEALYSGCGTVSTVATSYGTVRTVPSHDALYRGCGTVATAYGTVRTVPSCL